jgi:hypothetical protein
MKQLHITFLLGFWLTTTGAQTPSLLNQLASVNKEWLRQPDAELRLQQQPARQLTETELVALHLTQVERLLRNRQPVKFSPLQSASRKRLLDVLHGYIETGIFPKNYLFAHRQPVFIDPHHTFCAFGFLMKQSSAEAMAKDIQHTQNYAYLAQIQSTRNWPPGWLLRVLHWQNWR